MYQYNQLTTFLYPMLNFVTTEHVLHTYEYSQLVEHFTTYIIQNRPTFKPVT